MSASNSASDSKGTILIFDLKVHILFIGYDVTITNGLHLELSYQKMDLEKPGFELGTFLFQTPCSTTVLTLLSCTNKSQKQRKFNKKQTIFKK